MKKLLHACLASILAACACPAPDHHGFGILSGPGSGDTKDHACSDPVCFVNITVTGNCNVAFDPPEHIYIAADNGDMQIHWRLSGADFIDDDSVYLKKPGTNAGEFRFKMVSKTLFVAKNKHGLRGRSYEYGVRVMQNGNVCDTHPWIDN